MLIFRKLILRLANEMSIEQGEISPQKGLKKLFSQKIEYNSQNAKDCIKLVYIENSKKYSILEIRNLDYCEIANHISNNKKIATISMRSRAEKMNVF